MEGTKMKRAGAVLCTMLGILAISCGGGEEKTDTGAGAMGETAAASAGKGDAVKICLDLASRRDWANALDPCTRAANELPDDLRIQHALQQAQAAAGQ
jgi:hypothetical protein